MASLARTEPAARIPRDARLTTILLIGRIVVSGHDYLCRIRNISEGGMRIETLGPIRVGQQIEIELRNGIALAADIRWVKDADAGVRFDAPIDIATMLAPQVRIGATGGGRVARAPRLAAQCPLALRHNGRVRSAVMSDISQAGIGAVTNADFVEGDHTVLFIPGIGSRRASVRWVRGNCTGFSFENKLGFGDLATWLAGPDRFALGPAAMLTPSCQNS